MVLVLLKRWRRGMVIESLVPVHHPITHSTNGSWRWCRDVLVVYTSCSRTPRSNTQRPHSSPNGCRDRRVPILVLYGRTTTPMRLQHLQIILYIHFTKLGQARHDSLTPPPLRCRSEG